jgi:hypothetical protein
MITLEIPRRPDGGMVWPESVVVDLDGDTVESVISLVVDKGFGGQSIDNWRVRLRLARINAAKSTSERGKAASALVKSKTQGQVTLVTYKPYKFGGPDQFKGPDDGGPAYFSGEYMVEVILPDGTNLSDLLVTQGLAVYWDGTGPRPADFLTAPGA